MEQPQRILLIGRDLVLQRSVADAFVHAGCQTFEAMGNADGLRLLYDTRPDLIFLDISGAPSEGWETLERIREVTDAPAILVIERGENICRAWSKHKAAILVKPISPAQIIARARAWGMLKRVPKSRNYVSLTLRRLSISDLTSIDRALSQVGERGEVRLIVQQGRLRFLEKIVTTPLERESPSA